MADEMAATNPRIHVMHRPGKAGLGKAYLAGFRWALERGYEYSSRWMPISLTTHGTCPSSSTPLTLRPGARLPVQDGRERRQLADPRRLLSLVANLYAQVTGLPVVDSTGGFKCFRRGSWRPSI